MDTKQAPINSGFGAETTGKEVIAGIDLGDKFAVVTGGHSGIGLVTTRLLVDAGAKVVVGARDVKKAQAALVGLKNVTLVELDLADPASVDRFAARCLEASSTIHLLINNAGVMATPLTRDSRGYEVQLATNHLGHFQLTARLWDALKNARGSRVITLSSAGHRFAAVDLDDPNFLKRPYDKWAAYGQSKSANSLFAVELDRRGKEHGIRSFAVHPGRIMATDLARHMTDEDWKRVGLTPQDADIARPGYKNVEQGAATTTWCAVSPQLKGKGGVYCADCDISALLPNDSADLVGVRQWAVDEEAAKALWKLTERLIGMRLPE